MAKIMASRTVTSLSPDTRNGHRPSLTVQFWGDRSLGIRGSRKGPGKPREWEEQPKDSAWYKNLIQIDAATLKPVKPKAKKKNWTPPKDKTVTLDSLIAKFEQRRSK